MIPRSFLRELKANARRQLTTWPTEIIRCELSVPTDNFTTATIMGARPPVHTHAAQKSSAFLKNPCSPDMGRREELMSGNICEGGLFGRVEPFYEEAKK